MNAPVRHVVPRITSRIRRAPRPAYGCRVAGGNRTPGSHRSRREGLPSPGSCHLGHQNATLQAQWAKSLGYWRVIRRQHALAFWNGRSRRYFLRIQRIK